MCLYKTHRIPRIAKEDVYCIKTCHKLIKGIYETPYEHYKWNVSQPLIASGSLFEFLFCKEIKGGGVHAWISTEEIRPVYASKNEMILLCKIPSGALYFIGDNGDITARRIDFVKSIPFDIDHIKDEAIPWINRNKKL